MNAETRASSTADWKYFGVEFALRSLVSALVFTPVIWLAGGFTWANEEPERGGLLWLVALALLLKAMFQTGFSMADRRAKHADVAVASSNSSGKPKR